MVTIRPTMVGMPFVVIILLHAHAHKNITKNHFFTSLKIIFRFLHSFTSQPIPLECVPDNQGLQGKLGPIIQPASVTTRDRFHCIERRPAHTVTTRDRFHCIERRPAHAVTTRDRFHCIERWPAHAVTMRDRFHCIERWPAHAVTTRDRLHCIEVEPVSCSGSTA